MVSKNLFKIALISSLSANFSLAQTCLTGTEIPPSTPSSQFIDHGDGTVTDNLTSLMWKRCSEGLSGISCLAGFAGEYTWSEAFQRVETLNASGGFAGFSDWRVPNIVELDSLTEQQCAVPSINSEIFPNTKSSVYWSSTPNRSNTDSAWNVNFFTGRSDGYAERSSSWHLRLVR